ncbi:hypothetical protein B1A99_34055 [Cohnella sp. CIP 111063]|nr:hypothetical protein B1A99_34055 [Cohnella sp. CIP 111063]PRX58242.1 hypothetical protein B0G52_1361 [Cohnella sp. SGD-V74]
MNDRWEAGGGLTEGDSGKRSGEWSGRKQTGLTKGDNLHRTRQDAFAVLRALKAFLLGIRRGSLFKMSTLFLFFLGQWTYAII